MGWKRVVKIRGLLFVSLSMVFLPVLCNADHPGDINQDGYVGINDSVLSLQIMGGKNLSISPTGVETDINYDGKIGLEEAIYALQYQSYQPPDCAPYASLYDTSVPTAVVGEGTPESCTDTALQNAVSEGGIVVFNCGVAPTTIHLSSPILIDEATVIDGKNLITLSGTNTSRILYLDSAYNVTSPDLVVQRLSFINGKSGQTAIDTAAGGAAIYRDGGSLIVIDCSFTDNHAPATGQDVAGGAIYGFGGGKTVIVNSSFSGNSASNGGAVGSLNSDLLISHSVFTENSATGTGGNPGDGGCGGAVYMDGRDEAAGICRVKMADNEAGAIGGAFFRVSNDNTGLFSMESSTVDSNRVTAESSGNAGGLYLQGLSITLKNSTISRNQAFYNGGIWIHTADVEMTNTTIADNTAFGSNGGGIWLSNDPSGTILNCTIANNRSTAENQIAGAIFGAGLTLKNTVIAYNTAMWVPGCNHLHDDEGGNFQWPGGALCTSELIVSDPLLGDLSNYAGPTESMMPASNSPLKAVGSDCPEIDQRGHPRKEKCTAGAVEIH